MLSFSYSFLTGITNGVYAIFVGILIIILCREQFHVLTNFFILVFFQLYFSSLTLFAYVSVIIDVRNYCKLSSCNTQYYYYITLIVAYSGVMIALIILCTTIYNLIIIRNERIRPRAVPLTTTCDPD